MAQRDNGREEELRLAEYIVRRVTERATGRADPECLDNAPRDRYFIGNLRPREEPREDDDEPAYLTELIGKLSPVAFGAEFLVRPADGLIQVLVCLQWTCYYRVFPTLAHQRRFQLRESAQGEMAPEGSGSNRPDAATTSTASAEIAQEAALEPAELELGDGGEATRRGRRARERRESLALRYKKIECRACGRVIARLAGSAWEVDDADLSQSVVTEIQRAQAVVLSDPERLRFRPGQAQRIDVPADAVVTQTAYQAFLQSQTVDIVPAWAWQLGVTVRTDTRVEAEQLFLLRCEFTNSSPPVRDAEGRENTTIEPYLFDTSAHFSFESGDARSFIFDLAPRGFRYDRTLDARGFNCGVTRAGADPSNFRTTHTPIYLQRRYRSREEPEAPFEALATNPLPVLEGVLASMEDYRAVWEDAEREYSARIPGWEGVARPELMADRAQYDAEIQRFRRGIDLIRTNDDVLLAFRLTNDCFRRAGADEDPAKRKTAWRLFQLVFLVSQIPGMWALGRRDSQEAADREFVDIIYFPTGGGKTEAYLAVLVFHAFYDRLRGKERGVTAWTRFPLRLLTLQQTQRAVDIIGVAELVRAQQTDPRLSGRKAAGFTVGYFVGKAGTPNELVDPERYQYANGEDRTNWSIAQDPDARQRWKRVTRCPSCRTPTITVEFDSATTRLVHRCTSATCEFPSGILPFYIVDAEIYRYLPTVVIGTLDKLAGLGNQRKVAQILGVIDGWCPEHGYFHGKCVQKDCRNTALRAVPAGAVTGPTLFIQDELHLLKEELGTFDAHYETFLQRLCRELGQPDTLKIIASSATIEAFERQVEHLYGRARTVARVFPGSGPFLGESFYASTQSAIQRIYVGVLPHNKTIFNAMLELVEYAHEEVQTLGRLAVGSTSPFGGAVDVGGDDWRALTDRYATSLTYFLQTRELNSFRNDLQGDVSPSLERQGLSPLDIFELTGDTTADQVSQTLERLEQPVLDRVGSDAVLATSMISHGVDIDRLNLMLFYGVPRQNAEYIQASSRVGRTHVGIVFTCIHPARERDRSHYAYFTKYHEFLGQLVEPVAINRWAKFSVSRTLPGLFMAYLLQVLASRATGRDVDKFYMLDFLQQRIVSGTIAADEIADFLEEAYQVDVGPTGGNDGFRDVIRTRVRQFLDWLVNPPAGTRWASEALYPPPMSSLRDVDEAIPIELDADGDRWARLRGEEA